MGRQSAVFSLLMAAFIAAAYGSESRPFLGVYCLLLDSTSLDGNIVTYDDIPSLEFEVTIVNESDNQGIELDKCVSLLLDVEFQLAGVSVPANSLTTSWSPAGCTQTGAADAEENDLDFPLVLAPGATLRATLRLGRIDGPGFSAGDYSVILRAKPGLVRASRGADTIRGGIGSSRFVVRVSVPDADRLAALNILGSRAARHGALDEALDYFFEMDRLRPDNAAAAVGIGTTLAALNEHERAIPYLERAYADSPSSGVRSVIPLLLAQSLINVGDDGRAFEVLSESLSPANAVRTFGEMRAAIGGTGTGAASTRRSPQ